MLQARDIRYLRASQVKVAQIGEWALAAAILVFVVVGVRNLRLAAQLAADQETTIAAILNIGFQPDASYRGIVLFTMERISSGSLQILTGALLSIMLYLAISVRRRNTRILLFVEKYAPELLAETGEQKLSNPATK